MGVLPIDTREALHLNELTSRARCYRNGYGFVFSHCFLLPLDSFESPHIHHFHQRLIPIPVITDVIPPGVVLEDGFSLVF